MQRDLTHVGLQRDLSHIVFISV